MFKTTLTALLFVISAALPLHAQNNGAKIYASKDAMLEVLHEKMMAKDLFGAFSAMLPEGVTSRQALQTMQSLIDSQLAPRLFNVDRVMRLELESGFNRELYAYWTGTSYLYAVVTFHERENDVIVLQLFAHGQLSDALRQM